MTTKVSVFLNSYSLSAIDPRIVIQGVNEATPNWNITAVSGANRYGQRVRANEKRYRDVVVQFAIAEHRDMAARQRILQQVRSWAASGGWLEVSYREFQRLHVMCAGMPAVNGITKWAEAYSITFRAYGVPEWEAKIADEVHSAGRVGSETLLVTTDAGGPLRVIAQNTGGTTCNEMQFSCNGQTIILDSLGLVSGETFLMDYDDENLQKIMIQGSGGVWRSALDKRVPASNDDIMLKPGVNTVSYVTDYALGWSFYVYGRWLG